MGDDIERAAHRMTPTPDGIRPEANAPEGYGPEGNGTATGRRFRPELHGLRAVAVTLVVVYHVWLGRVSGGVDVFFLITGFLLTGQLLRAVEGGGGVSVRRLAVRTLTLLLPAALVVLLATATAGMLLLPESRWMQTAREVMASALLVQNWQLAADSVDYAARSNAASVVQHFWSLSIQVQVMLVAPVLVALVALTARGVGASPRRRHLTGVLAGVFVVSLGYSVALTATNQPLAYFHTLTRLWEFALGGLLALVIDRIALAPRVRVRLGWAGLAGLAACGLVLQGDRVFPGVAALWPTACAAMVLVAGSTGVPHGADRWLSCAPVRRLADLSYALYLWHWPVLVLTLVAARTDQLGFLAGLAVVAVPLALAFLTHRLVEQPLARRPPGSLDARRAGAAAGCWQVAAAVRASTDATLGSDRHPGALALGADVELDDLLPAPAAVNEDWVRIEHWECAQLRLFPTEACRQPVVGEPDRRIVVVGDSHMQQLTGALVPIAEQANWELISIMFGACPFSTSSEVMADEQSCLDWNEAAAAEIADIRPDAVVTLASRDVRTGLTEQTPPGFVERWWQLNDLGIPVLAVRDNPRFDYSPPDCVQQLGRGAPECGVARAEVYAPEPPWALRDDVPPNVTFLDLSDALCADALCPVEVGNVLVYMDDNHLTASFTTSMAPVLEGKVRAAIGG